MFLFRYFQSAEPACSNEPITNDENDEIDDIFENAFETTADLNSLLLKQKFYVQMIESLRPEDELSSKEAESRYEHVSQLFKKFISNQSEITTMIEEEAFEEQLNTCKEIQSGVLSIQKTLKEIISLAETAMPETAQGSLNRTERSEVMVDFLESWRKKRKSLIEQIELIEAKNDLSPTEAEISYDHLTQLHESFLRNQAKIETNVDNSALDGELEISAGVFQKVLSIQTKLKEIFAPVEPSASSSFVDESRQFDESLESLLEKRKLIADIIELANLLKEIVQQDASNRNPEVRLDHEKRVELAFKRLAEYEKLSILNRKKIEELSSDENLDELTRKMFTKLENHQMDISEMFTGISLNSG